MDETRDRQIADHVLRMHRYLPPGVEEGTPVIDSLTQQLSVENTATQTNGQTEEADASPFEKFDPLLHFGFTDEAKRMQQGNGVATRTRRKKKEGKVEILSISFVKKYLQYAKSKPAPVLTKGAADHIVNVYASLRNEQAEGNQKRVSAFSHLWLFYNVDNVVP